MCPSLAHEAINLFQRVMRQRNPRECGTSSRTGPDISSRIRDHVISIVVNHDFDDWHVLERWVQSELELAHKSIVHCQGTLPLVYLDQDVGLVVHGCREIG